MCGQAIFDVSLTNANNTARISFMPNDVNADRVNVSEIYVFEWAPMLRVVAALNPSYGGASWLGLLPSRRKLGHGRLSFRFSKCEFKGGLLTRGSGKNIRVRLFPIPAASTVRFRNASLL
jgi:hypothetical protein